MNRTVSVLTSFTQAHTGHFCVLMTLTLASPRHTGESHTRLANATRKRAIASYHGAARLSSCAQTGVPRRCSTTCSLLSGASPGAGLAAGAGPAAAAWGHVSGFVTLRRGRVSPISRVLAGCHPPPGSAEPSAGCLAAVALCPVSLSPPFSGLSSWRWPGSAGGWPVQRERRLRCRHRVEFAAGSGVLPRSPPWRWQQRCTAGLG